MHLRMLVQKPCADVVFHHDVHSPLCKRRPVPSRLSAAAPGSDLGSHRVATARHPLVFEDASACRLHQDP